MENTNILRRLAFRNDRHSATQAVGKRDPYLGEVSRSTHKDGVGTQGVDEHEFSVHVLHVIIQTYRNEKYAISDMVGILR